MNTFWAFLLTFLGLASAATIITKQNPLDEFRLESPHITNWGVWGEIEHCPVGSFVYGMRIKVQPESGILVDDTALNGVELLCASPSSTKRSNATESKEFASITSTVGHKGGWTPILECPIPTFAIGFQLRSEGSQSVADDSAGNDIRLFCSNLQIIGGFEAARYGDWTVEQHCPRGMSLCGIQTQVEVPGPSDETSLNNVNMWCCE